MNKTLPLSQLPDNLTSPSDVKTISLDNGRFCNKNNPKESVKIYDCLTFYRGYIVNYRSNCGYYERTEKQIDTEKNLRNKEYNGYMSRHTASTVRRLLTGWLTSIEVHNNIKLQQYQKREAYITFATLTLPATQSHDDNFIKRNVLMPFIQQIKRNHNVKYYFWRAEAQKNGNIHFHLIIDKYVDYKVLQNRWNSQLSNHGYIDRFEEKYKHRHPPSTHIIKVEGISNFIEYVIDYCIKKGETRQITGRIWGISDELRNIKPLQTEDIIDTDVILQELTENNQIEVLQYEHFNILLIKTGTKLNDNNPILRRTYTNHYLHNYYTLYDQSKLPKKQSKPIKNTEETNQEPVQQKLTL